jgi:hypothetical protein
MGAETGWRANGWRLLSARHPVFDQSAAVPAAGMQIDVIPKKSAGFPADLVAAPYP